MSSSPTPPEIPRPDLPRTTIIIGAGIVGTALAHYLSLHPKASPSHNILLLDRTLTHPANSTTLAPGLIGQFNDSTILTSLAVESVRAYRDIPHAFSPCGGLEVAVSEAGMANLRSRAAVAKSRDLPAELLSAEETVRLAPDFVRVEDAVGGLHFPTDGGADPVRITAWFRGQAESRGVEFLEAEISHLIFSPTEGMIGVETTAGQHLPCSNLVLATGIWTQNLIQQLGITSAPPIPIIPVSHPYVFSTQRATRSLPLQPFVRWPELQIYARDHASRDGIGTYDHVPLAIPSSTSLSSASSTSPQSFTSALETALSHLPSGTRNLFPIITTTTTTPPTAGIFALTPDNQPLLGPLPPSHPSTQPQPQIYLAAAIWITHAASCARVLADLLTSPASIPSPADAAILAALDPNRFSGLDERELQQQALQNYNHIYRSGSESAKNSDRAL